MGIVIKQGIWNSAITYIGILLGFAITIFLYPRIFTPDQYGLTRILISVSLVGTRFAHLGVQNLIYRYYPFFKNFSKRNHGLLFFSLLIPLIGFLIFSGLYWVFRDIIQSYYIDSSPLFVDYFFWVLPITLFLLYFEVLNSYLTSLRDSITGSFLSEIFQRIVVIVLLFLYVLDTISFNTFILFFTVGYGLHPLVLAVRIWQMGEFNLKPNFNIFRKGLVMDMTSYSLYTLLGGLTTVIVWNVDVIMLGAMVSLTATGIYSIAFYIGSVIAVPKRAIEKIATPLVAEFIQKDAWDEIRTLYQKTSLNQLIAGTGILVLIWINIDVVFEILPDVYAEGHWVILIIGIGKLIDMATGINGIIILNSEHYRFSFYSNIFLVLITIVTNLLMIPVYGIVGAAAATTFSILLYNTAKYLFVFFKFKMQPFTIHTFQVIGITVILLIILFLIPTTGLIWVDAVLLSTLFVVLYGGIILWLSVSDDLNNLVTKLYQKIKPGK